jgi:hypothetical protein
MTMQRNYCCDYGGKKIGDIGGTINTVVMLAVLGGAGYLAYKLLNGGLTPGTGTTANNNAITATSATTAAAATAASTAAGVKQTVPDSTLNGYVTAITNIITPSTTFPLDEDTSQQVQNIVISVNTKTDWYRLVQLFGTKNYNAGGSGSLCGWFAIDCQQADLPGLLKVALQPDVISAIDSYFANTFGDTEVQI